MRKRIFQSVVMFTLMGFSVCISQAQVSSINVVTTAVPFLRISPDARSGGMGDVGIATPADANAVYWNRAKLPFAEQPGGITLTYTPWLADLGLNDVYLASVGGYYKLNENEVISSSLRYFSLGNIQFTDALGNQLQSFLPKEFAFDGGYSRKISPKSSLSVVVKYINSDLANGYINGQTYKAGSTVAGDLHYFHNNTQESGEGLAWGISITNLGGKISYTTDATQKDYIPANLGLGIAYTKVYNPENKITFAADVNKLLVPTPPVATGNDSINASALSKYHSQGVVGSWFNSFSAPGGFSEEIQQVQASVGAEYWYQNQFSFRAGYFYENPNAGDRKYFTMGAGLKYNTFSLLFSYLLPSGSGTTRNPLSNTIRFSMVFDLGSNNGEKVETAK